MMCTSHIVFGIFISYFAHGRWFCPGTLASSTTKSGRHDIAEILLKVALNTINQSINQPYFLFRRLLDDKSCTTTSECAHMTCHEGMNHECVNMLCECVHHHNGGDGNHNPPHHPDGGHHG
jgi:hypothetical protein